MSDEAAPAGSTSGVSAPRRRHRRPPPFKPPAVATPGSRRPAAGDAPGRPGLSQVGSPGQLGAPGSPTQPGSLTQPGSPSQLASPGQAGQPGTRDEAAADGAGTAETVLHFRAGSVLLVAGIPGAGKSTLIHRLFGGTSPADVLVLDSADIRAAFARRLGPGMPYRLYRPAVHTVHYARIAAWTLGPRRNLVVHECGTRDWARRTMARLAALRRRPAHLLLLDTPPETALAGQRSRGRLVRTSSFLRHSRQWMRLGCAVDAMTAADAMTVAPAATAPSATVSPAGDGAVAAGSGPARSAIGDGKACGRAGRRLSGPPDLGREGWTSARRLDRDKAAALQAIYFDR